MKATHHFNSHYADILGVLPAILLQAIYDQISHLYHAQKGEHQSSHESHPRPKGQASEKKCEIYGSNLALLGYVPFMTLKQVRLAKETLIKNGYIEYNVLNGNKFRKDVGICLSDNLNAEMLTEYGEKTGILAQKGAQMKNATSIYNNTSINNTNTTLVTTPKRASIKIADLEVESGRNTNGSYRIISVKDKKNPERSFPPAEKYAIWCWLHIRDNFPDFKFVKDADLEKWARDIELLLKEIDNKEEMVKIFFWAVQDREESGNNWKGWWQQIRSTAKFRKKYEELRIKWQSVSSSSEKVKNTALYAVKKDDKMQREIKRIEENIKN